MMKEAEDGDKVYEKPKGKVNPDNLEQVMDAVSYVLSNEVKRLKDLFEKETEKEVGFNTFWNEKYQVELVALAKLWGVKACINGVIIELKK